MMSKKLIVVFIRSVAEIKDKTVAALIAKVTLQGAVLKTKQTFQRTCQWKNT